MSKSGSSITYGYNADGKRISKTVNGTTYNGNRYFYLKNAQGDVTGLVNASGTQVVSYTYDPWGAPMSTDGTMASTLGAANPLRYRGYVYDTETGLYYLSSRYYNPVWGRFINADTAAVVAASPTKPTGIRISLPTATMTQSTEKMMAGNFGILLQRAQ